ncbi:MAG TPA: hypothetical protein PLR88_02220 [Bacteroidales bacterium]|nr:hypothetical protein [Bacteroidales bacterium]HPT20734.1 hypothetical protein [Bacteroidales bacterium]
MTFSEKFNRIQTGLISGLLFPFIIGIVVFLFSSGNYTLHTYLARLINSDILTHAISLCVFPNILIFLVFIHFDMLRAARGTLAVTIIWAIIVFSIKFLL